MQWINGEYVTGHEIGHLPFKEEVNKFLNFGEENKLTVAVDNILDSETVPQGYVDEINM